ncbi:MAG: TldD/PmbA family protein [Candidatus Dormibacteria bacterium]
MSTVRQPAELFDLADAVLAAVPAGTEAEVSLAESTNALTRYANGAIHQSVSDTTLLARLRLIREGRCGVAQATSADLATLCGLAQVAEHVRQASVAAAVVPLYVPDGGSDDDSAWSDTTAAFTAEQRADAVAVVCEAASAQDQLAYGTFETNLVSRVIVSTAGLRRGARCTDAEMIAVCRGADGTGYAARYGNDVAAIEPQAVAAEVTERCAQSQAPVTADPGEYEVVFAPYATAEMLEYLGYMGFSGLAVEEKRSFMRFGERLMSASVTIADDVHAPGARTLPFDGEGATSQAITYIDSGTCRGVAHDSVTAARAGVGSTGHSLPQPNGEGPLPRVITMEAGEASEAELITGIQRGLLVTRMWYVRPVHPGRTIITGMTRDGTFLVKGGRVVGPVNNLRFTQSIADALGDVRAIGRQRMIVRGSQGAIVAPWLHVGRFTFSS